MNALALQPSGLYASRYAAANRYGEVTANVRATEDNEVEWQTLSRHVALVHSAISDTHHAIFERWLAYVRSKALSPHAETRSGIEWRKREEPSTGSKDSPVLAPLPTVHLGMERLSRLRAGWAGEESVAPTREAIADARAFLVLAERAGLPEPMVSATESGEITFDWRSGEQKASARFEGDGFFGYALYRDGRYYPGKEDADLVSDALPEELVTYLKPTRKK